MTRHMKEGVQASRFAGASPVSHSRGLCQTERINRFGTYVLNPNRTSEPLEQHLQIALAGIEASTGIFDQNPWCAMKRARYSSGRKISHPVAVAPTGSSRRGHCW